MKRSFLLASALALTTVAGCFGTDTGNPPVTAGLRARSSDPSVSVGPGGSAPAVDTAWLALESVRVVLGEGCDHVSEPVDHDVAGELVGGLPLAGLLDGGSCGVHLAFAAPTALPVGAPAGLADRILFVTGRRADGAPFELALLHVDTVDVVAPAPIVLRADTPVLVVFDVAAWLAELDLDALPLDGDGVARLDPGAPEAAGLTRGFAASIELYLDVGADGRFGLAEEAAGPIASSHR